jgi:tetratricopeptide (TPR) repeat protein
MSDALKEEGLALFRRGMHDEARAKFEEARASYVAGGDAHGAAEMLNNIGVVARVQRDYDAADEAFSAASDSFAEAGDQAGRATVLANLGDLDAARGDAEAAARHYSDAAELFAEAGDHDKQSQLLRALSLMRLRQRRFYEAISLMELSLSAQPRPGPLQRIFLVMLRFLSRLMGG